MESSLKMRAKHWRFSLLLSEAYVIVHVCVCECLYICNGIQLNNVENPLVQLVDSTFRQGRVRRVHFYWAKCSHSHIHTHQRIQCPTKKRKENHTKSVFLSPSSFSFIFKPEKVKRTIFIQSGFCLSKGNACFFWWTKNLNVEWISIECVQSCQ